MDCLFSLAMSQIDYSKFELIDTSSSVEDDDTSCSIIGDEDDSLVQNNPNTGSPTLTVEEPKLPPPEPPPPVMAAGLTIRHVTFAYYSKSDSDSDSDLDDQPLDLTTTAQYLHSKTDSKLSDSVEVLATVHDHLDAILSSTLTSEQLGPLLDLTTTTARGSHQNFLLPNGVRRYLRRTEMIRVEREIGHGTYGKVYRVCRNNETVMALKVIDLDRVSARYRGEFLRQELAAMATIPAHPHLVGVYDLFKLTGRDQTTDSVHDLMVMLLEYCPNGDMYNYLSVCKHVQEPIACHWFQQLLQAVAHVHQHGFAHRDLKLDNLLFDADYGVKLTDFGLCCRLNLSGQCARCGKHDTDQQHSFELPNENYCGCFIYSSPELLMGRPYLATKNDVWSCGVILYVMLFGDYPVDGAQYTVAATTGRHVSDLFYPTVTYPAEVPITPECRQVLDAIFVPEESRVSVADLLQLPWFRLHLPLDPSMIGQQFNTLADYFRELSFLPKIETASFEFDASESETPEKDSFG